MPAIMRRTPATEEASSYGYVDFLKDVVQKTVADTTAGFKRPTDFSDEEIMEMAFAGVGGGTKISKGLDPIKGILKRYKSQGLTYDAFVNQIPDKPKFAYHQWTFRGEGPLARATVTTKGTSLDEFEEMVADRLRKFAKPMITATGTSLVKRRSQEVLTKLKDLRLMNRPEVDDFIGVRERSINRALRDLAESKGNVGAEADVNSWLRRTIRDIDKLRKGATIKHDLD